MGTNPIFNKENERKRNISCDIIFLGFLKRYRIVVKGIYRSLTILCAAPHVANKASFLATFTGTPSSSVAV
jgi:hypothetical protein